MVRTRYKVLDASVIIKWFAKEEGSEKAFVYLDDHQKGLSSIIVPGLLYYELGNSLITKKATKHQVSEVMETMQALHLTVEQTGEKAFRKVFENASEYQITFYDSAYVTLMQQKNCEFITADKKLYQKLQGTFAHVVLL